MTSSNISKKGLVILVTKPGLFLDIPRPALVIGTNRNQNHFSIIHNSLKFMVARDGIEPPTPAFSGLRSMNNIFSGSRF
jgi:hypothetical protein